MPKQQKGTTPSLELCKVTAAMVLWRVSALPDNPCRIKVEHSCLFLELQFHLLHPLPSVGVTSSSLRPPALGSAWLSLTAPDLVLSLWLTTSSLLIPDSPAASTAASSPGCFGSVTWSVDHSSLPLKCPKLCCCWTCIHSVTTYTCLCILLSTVWYELFLAIKIRIKEPAFALTRLPR